MIVRARDLLLIPNILSVCRIALLAVPAYMISTRDPGLRIPTLCFIGLGIITDLLDGYLARRLNMVSDLGKILDPLADKISTGVLVVFLNIYEDFPLWAVVLVLSRDFAVLVLSLIFIRKRHLVLPSNEIGRYAALSWGLVVFVFVADIDVIKEPSLIAATALLVASAASYIERFIRRLRSDSQSSP
jgi:CDP-diacylglycerol--glycerol-3-phosphate 3-phosphatidyltransferase